MKPFNIKKIAILAFSCSVIFVSILIAQAQEAINGNEPISIETAMTFQSDILEEECRILVRLPEGWL
ncbi:hypothetical protein [Fodinibius sediminis]|uniref:Uncharacterized protein n=1 Tax=Fodinibius sediminis TaxID=1214077 RepID=A0A521DCQ3_9BACT|nr:hypothetical protein [Fodinibius sediminis]SMO69453.1 hypothetical protein SAMN06265218_109192 [Fodinibius sediminis]